MRKTIILIFLLSFISLNVTIAAPSYHQGFARSAGESANPWLLRQMQGAWIPELGISGTTLHDASGRKKNGAFVNLDGTNWGITPDGYMLNYTSSGVDHVALGGQIINHKFASSLVAVIRSDSGSSSSVGRIIYGERPPTGNQIWSFGAFHTSSGANELLFVWRNDLGGSLTQTFGTININDGLTHVVGLSKVGTQITLYVDGKVDVTDTLGGSDIPVNTATVTWIGADSRDNQERSSWDETIGAVMIWGDRALTQNEHMRLAVDYLAPFRLRQPIFKAPAAPPAGDRRIMHIGQIINRFNNFASCIYN